MATTISPFMYLGFMCLGVAVTSAIFGFRTIINETSKLSFNNFRPILSSATFGSSFNLFTFFAYRNGANVGVADAINNTTVFLVILLEVLLLKDKDNFARKIIGAIVATSGVILNGIN